MSRTFGRGVGFLGDMEIFCRPINYKYQFIKDVLSLLFLPHSFLGRKMGDLYNFCCFAKHFHMH